MSDLKTTAVFVIGNSDNKLTQQSWHNFVQAMSDQFRRVETTIHFAGGSNPDAPWQNYCWVVECHPAVLVVLRKNIAIICNSFLQDSIAMIQGETQFISPLV